VAALQFTTDIKIRGVNPYVIVNGQPDVPWHINMMPVGNGDFYLYLHGGIRKASNSKVGDTVTIEVDFDKDYKNGPLHPMPEWFSLTLEQNPEAQANWDALPPSRQKEVLRYFAGLKSTDARERNTQKALDVLSGNTRRFMGRSWHDGS
jgi:hypothetical protein